MRPIPTVATVVTDPHTAARVLRVLWHMNAWASGVGPHTLAGYLKVVEQAQQEATRPIVNAVLADFRHQAIPRPRSDAWPEWYSTAREILVDRISKPAKPVTRRHSR